MMTSDSKDTVEGKRSAGDASRVAGKTHWAVYLSLGLTIFIGGLLTAPYVERGLATLGYMPGANDADILNRTVMMQNDDHQTLAALGARLASVESASVVQNETLSNVTARLAEVETRPNIAGKSASVNLAPMDQRISALEENHKNLVQSRENEKTLKAVVVAHDYDSKVRALALELTPLINAAIRADARGADGTVWENIKGWARSLVVVRPIDDLEGDGLAVRLSRAEKAISKGTMTGLRKAVDEISPIEGFAAEVLAPWLVKAHDIINATDTGVDEAQK